MACLASSGVHSAYWSFSWPRKSPPKPNKPDLKSSFLHFLSREETYGAELYKIFPLCAPGEVGFEFSLEEQLTEPLKMQGSHILKKLIEENPAIVAGDGRTLGTQALMQVSQHHRQQRRKSRKKLRATFSSWWGWVSRCLLPSSLALPLDSSSPPRSSLRQSLTTSSSMMNSFGLLPMMTTLGLTNQR